LASRWRLINLADAAVADVLLHPLLTNVAVAAEHLHGEVGGLETQTSEERLHRRRQQRYQVLGGGSPGRVAMAALLTERARSSRQAPQRPST
jgi:hypothetical protein